MDRTARAGFLALILAQAAHSIEEYVGKLYDVFPPARYVTGLVASDRKIGFVIFNAGLVALGFACFLGPVRRGSRRATGIAWAWVALEAANGCGHLAWAVVAGGYRPGLATAPLLLTISVWLGWRLAARSPATRKSWD